MVKKQFENFRILLIVLGVFCVSGAGTCVRAGEWKVSKPQSIQPNKLTTITLERVNRDEASTGTVEIISGHIDLVIPHGIQQQDADRVEVPIFSRGSNYTARLFLLSHNNDVVTSLSIPVSSSDQNTPRIVIEGFEGLPLVFANQPVTPTLSMKALSETGAKSAHIEVRDHKDRIVVSRFFSTDDLQQGRDAFRVPAAGSYQVVCRFLVEPLTSMPLAAWRDPINVPFGRVAANLDDPFAYSDLITTDVVVGSRVTLEHIPTTATVVGEDRLPLSVLARHSTEISKNDWPFAINGADTYRQSSGTQDVNFRKLLRIQKLLGGNIAPVLIKWSDFQTGPESYRWFELNEIIPAYRTAGIRPMLSVSGRAKWNDELPTQSSATLTAWNRGMRALSEKYQSMLWGLNFGQHQEDVWPGNPQIEYTDMLRATWEGFLGRSNGVLSGPPIAIGYSKGFNREWLDEILTSVTVPMAGALAFELYPPNTKSSPESNGFAETFMDARRLLRNNRAGHIGLWLSGTGWPTGVGGVSRELQANYLVRAHVLALAGRVDRITWDGILDKYYPWQGTEKDNMGLLNSDLSLKPSGIAYNIMTYMMSGVTSGTVSKLGKATIYKFHIPQQNNKWPGLLYVAWTGSPNDQEVIKLDMSMGGGVYALDYLGAEIPASNIDENSKNPLLGTFSVPIGFEPVFIWDAGKPGHFTTDNS